MAKTEGFVLIGIPYVPIDEDNRKKYPELRRIPTGINANGCVVCENDHGIHSPIDTFNLCWIPDPEIWKESHDQL